MSPASAAAGLAPVHGEWPLVGRAGELRLLGAQLRRSDAGGCVLVGPAGVGKNRLAAEVLAMAGSAGLPTARVAATRAAARMSFRALQALLPAGDPGPPDDPAAAGGPVRAELIRRTAGALAARAGGDGGGGRLVLQIDNAHHLDDASATLVHQLVAARGAGVLLTVRCEEPVPPGVTALVEGPPRRAGRACPARRRGRGRSARARAGRAGRPRRGGPAGARSQGNLLFLRELVLSAVESRALLDDAGM